MKKVILVIMLGVMLFGFGGCLKDDKDEDKPAIIGLSVESNMIAADGKDWILLNSEIRNKNNEVLAYGLSGKNIDYYVNEIKFYGDSFKTYTAGEYKITARIGNLKSNEILVKATQVITTDAGLVLKERENSYEVSDYVGTSKSVTIPEEINGKKVLKILSSSFDAKGIEEIKFPDTITEIRANAFSHNNLTKIELPNSLEIIEDGAFLDNKIISVKFNNSLKTIETIAFYGNELQSLNFPESLIKIENGAFENNKLTYVNLNNRLYSIEDDAFNNNNLTEIEVPKSVNVIGSNAFYQFNNNFVIRGFAGSAAETYAKATNTKFEVITE